MKTLVASFLMVLSHAAFSASPALILPIDRSTYETLHGSGTAPDCTASELLFSDGICRFFPSIETKIESDGREVYKDNRRNLFCDRAQLAASRSSDTNLFVSQMQKFGYQIEDWSYENESAASNENQGAPLFETCRDCGICGDKEPKEIRGHWTIRPTRNIIKRPGHGAMPGIPGPDEGKQPGLFGPKVPGLVLTWHF